MIHRFAYWFVCFSFYCLFKLFYRIEVVGKENIPEGPAIIAPNHISYLDPPILGATCPKQIHYLANAYLFKVPIMGRAIRYLNSHPVNTEAQDTQALKMILRLLHEGHKVLVFPEGTRSLDGKLQPLKLGCAMMAIHAHCPIVPVRIEGANEIWPKERKYPKLTGTLKVTYLKPLYPEMIEATTKKEAQILLTRELEKKLS